MPVLVLPVRGQSRTVGTSEVALRLKICKDETASLYTRCLDLTRPLLHATHILSMFDHSTRQRFVTPLQPRGRVCEHDVQIVKR